MGEREWVEEKLKPLTESCIEDYPNVRVEAHKKIPYGHEIVNYSIKGENEYETSKYETDLLISEQGKDNKWKPRIIVEVKMNNISTHSALAYSKKAGTHKDIHPYLRYGVFLVNRDDSPLPGKLFRHGDQFDFMISIRGYEASGDEFKNYQELLHSEIKASQQLEHIIYDSRKRNREKYTVLQHKLCLSK